MGGIHFSRTLAWSSSTENRKPSLIRDYHVLLFFFIYIFSLLWRWWCLVNCCCFSIAAATEIRFHISYKAILKIFDWTFLFHSRVGPFGSEINSLMSSPYRFVHILWFWCSEKPFPLLPSFAGTHSIQSIHITCIDGHHKDNCNKKDDAKRKKISCTTADGGLVGTASGEINLVNQCFGRGLQGF